jgi:hypothetical protein
MSSVTSKEIKKMIRELHQEKDEYVRQEISQFYRVSL